MKVEEEDKQSAEPTAILYKVGAIIVRKNS